jgi:hypothetical protein
MPLQLLPIQAVTPTNDDDDPQMSLYIADNVPQRMRPTTTAGQSEPKSISVVLPETVFQ